MEVIIIHTSLRKSSAFDSKKSIFVMSPNFSKLDELKETLSYMGFEVTCKARVETVYEITVSKPNKRDMSFTVRGVVTDEDLMSIYSQVGILCSEHKEQLDRIVVNLMSNR